uniref:CRAL-TRIO domain-containing protein n=1 Tax=Lygus hesperus TaxID=30085 RepID=A0A0K8T2K9_LYGHE
MSLEPLTIEQEDRILKDIVYSRSQLRPDIVQLREWLKKQEHLPLCRLKESDTFLSNFLVGCKGSMETAKRKLDFYYTLRGKGDVFINRDTPEYLDTCNSFAAVIQLPKNTSDGSRVYLARLTNANVDAFSPIAYLKTGLLLLEHRLRNDGILGGETYFIDCSNLTLRHFFKISPTEIRAFLSFFLEANPLRVKKIIIASAPPVLAAAINNIFLPFISLKIRERYMISNEPLEKIVDCVEMLPSDYEGGKEKSLADLADEWKATLKNTLSGLSKQLQEGVDENRRPTVEGGIPNPYFGLNGSIKSLVVD